MCTCAHVSMPPATTGCTPTPWHCTPKHPPLYTHGQGWHGCAKGCSYPRQSWDAPALPPPHCAGPRGEQGWGKWLYWHDSPRGAPRAALGLGREGEAVCQRWAVPMARAMP